jgi:hypothetical protein
VKCGDVWMCERWREECSLERIAATNTAAGEQEPVHEDSLAIVVGIVSEETMPLVFLFTAALTSTTVCLHFSTRQESEREREMFCVSIAFFFFFFFVFSFRCDMFDNHLGSEVVYYHYSSSRGSGGLCLPNISQSADL